MLKLTNWLFWPLLRFAALTSSLARSFQALAWAGSLSAAGNSSFAELLTRINLVTLSTRAITRTTRLTDC